MRIGSVCSCLVFVFFCLPLVSSCNAAPKIPAVVSVDMQRLMTESEPAKQASEHLGEVYHKVTHGNKCSHDLNINLNSCL